MNFHPGEKEAQHRFNEGWSEEAARLGRLIGNVLDDKQARFIEGRSFFFLATSDADGNCDCSFKGTEPDRGGVLLPVAWVAGPQQVLFPDYAGNGMYNSLGNLLVNPHAGLIFIDFALQARLRVNGTARVLDDGEWRKRWPQAERAVEVIIEQVYWNCSKRIPKQLL